MEKEESQLNITEEELQRFQNAMKSEEFRKMFTDYAREISNPENRKRYEEEIAQLEAERGMDVKFINPQELHDEKEKCNADIRGHLEALQFIDIV